MREFALNKEKSISSLLYVCQKLGGFWDVYSLIKILYFAEKKHLLKYGRPITGDKIIAMPFGPVLSFSYDEVKAKLGGHKYFKIKDNVAIAKEEPEMDYLSESDIECLNESIEENKGLGFGELKRKSHDGAYDKTIATKGRNAVVSYIDIARESGANDEMIKYITSNSENSRLEIN